MHVVFIACIGCMVFHTSSTCTSFRDCNFLWNALQSLFYLCKSGLSGAVICMVIDHTWVYNHIPVVRTRIRITHSTILPFHRSNNLQNLARALHCADLWGFLFVAYGPHFNVIYALRNIYYMHANKFLKIAIGISKVRNVWIKNSHTSISSQQWVQ